MPKIIERRRPPAPGGEWAVAAAFLPDLSREVQMELVLPVGEPVLGSAVKQSGPAVLSVFSGKGGVGKTVVAANLAVALAAELDRVLLVDCDVCVGQAHLVLGLMPSCGLGQVVRGSKELSDIVVRVGEKLMLAPGGPSGGRFFELRGREVRALVAQAKTSMSSTSAVVLDSGPCCCAAHADFAAVADVPVVLTTPEPAAMRATVALVESVLCHRSDRSLSIVVNMASGRAEAAEVFERIRGAVVPVFQAEPELLGWLPADEAVGESLRARRPLVERDPGSAFAAGLRRLASELAARLGGGRGAATGVAGEPEGDATDGSDHADGDGEEEAKAA